MNLRSRIRVSAVVTASVFAAACSAACSTDRVVSSALPARSAEARPAADSATMMDDVQFRVAQFSGYLLLTGRQ